MNWKIFPRLLHIWARCNRILVFNNTFVHEYRQLQLRVKSMTLIKLDICLLRRYLKYAQMFITVFSALLSSPWIPEGCCSKRDTNVLSTKVIAPVLTDVNNKICLQLIHIHCLLKPFQTLWNIEQIYVLSW